MFEEQRQSSKLLEPRSFDVCKNTAIPMIVMLVHSKVDTESNDCRKVLENNRDANGMLIMMWKGAGFFHKDKCKFIDLFIQSISRLCYVSQLYSRTKEQKESSGVI